MGFSFVHLIILALIIGVIFGPKPFHRAGLSVGDFWRNLKKGYEGKEDIEISAKPVKDRLHESHSEDHND